MEETSDLERKVSEIEAEILTLDLRRSQLQEELLHLRREFLQKSISTQPRLQLQITTANYNDQQPIPSGGKDSIVQIVI